MPKWAAETVKFESYGYLERQSSIKNKRRVMSKYEKLKMLLTNIEHFEVFNESTLEITLLKMFATILQRSILAVL